jgi:hypothetical protein
MKDRDLSSIEKVMGDKKIIGGIARSPIKEHTY